MKMANWTLTQQLGNSELFKLWARGIIAFSQAHIYDNVSL